jgi:hypothetical protein
MGVEPRYLYSDYSDPRMCANGATEFLHLFFR